jgi:hypothetical protein
MKNDHNLLRLLRFFIGVRLALGCDLLFLRWLPVIAADPSVIAFHPQPGHLPQPPLNGNPPARRRRPVQGRFLPLMI